MNIRFIYSLQARVTLVFLLVSLIPLGIVSVAALRTADRVINEIVTSELENVAAEKQELLQRWIGERKADLAVVSGSAAVGSMDTSQIGPYLLLVQKEYGVYDRFSVADLEGREVYDTQPSGSNGYQDEVWFRQALERGSYMSEVRLGPNGRDSVFLISVLVSGKSRQPAGVLCAAVGTRAILSGVLSVSLGQSGECYLVDRKGTFLAHKEPRRIFRENIAQSESFAFMQGNHQPGTVYTDYRGIEVLGASRKVAGTEWYLVVEQDRDEAFTGAMRLRRTIYLLIAATVAGVAGLSWLLAFYLAAPIRALSHAADGVARGDYEAAFQEARTTRRDESGALNVTFQNMAGQLKDPQVQLETRMGLTEAELHKVEAELKGTLEAAARSERLAAVGRLAAGVAHEIRTPLTSLKLFLPAVQEEIAVSAEQHEDYQIAMRQVGRIETTIKHFLDFARPREPVFGPLD
ncbi:MAG: cache domain-containing protein, partial [Thermoguttaceae bacterium]